jgi:hypothetical protein
MGGGHCERATAFRTHEAVTYKQMTVISDYGTHDTSFWRTGNETRATSFKCSIKRCALTENVPRTSLADSLWRDVSLKAENNIFISPVSIMWSRPVLTTGFLSKALRDYYTSLANWHYNCRSAGKKRRSEDMPNNQNYFRYKRNTTKPDLLYSGRFCSSLKLRNLNRINRWVHRPIN